MPSLSALLAITVFTPTLAGCLLLLSWLQHRRVTALALWGSGFIIASIAATLIIVARGTIPDFWSITVGNALLAAAYGILWSGARALPSAAPIENSKIAAAIDLASIGRYSD